MSHRYSSRSKYNYNNKKTSDKYYRRIDTKINPLNPVSLIVCTLLAFLVSPAFGHYVYEKYDYVVGDNPNAHPSQATDGCVESRLEISHGSTGAGYYKTEMKLMRNPTDWENAWWGVHPCKANYDTVYAGQFAAKQYHQKWNERRQAWETCTATTGWNFNKQNENTITIIVNESKDTPHCGAGWYRNSSALCVQAPTTSSTGRWSCQYSLSSGRHWLPD